jgi:hypothetical protein
MIYFETRQCTKKLGNFTFNSRFDNGNACDFKQAGNSGSNSFEVYPASDNHGFLFLI